MAAGVGLSLGSTAAAAASGHWARDALCSAVGLVGAVIWIGVWSRLARSVKWARAMGGHAALCIGWARFSMSVRGFCARVRSVRAVV